MSDVIIVALISLAGTVISGIISSVIAKSVTVYRIEQLEKKVDKHNNLIERVFKLEQHGAVIDEKISVANHRIDDLEHEQQGT